MRLLISITALTVTISAIPINTGLSAPANVATSYSTIIQGTIRKTADLEKAQEKGSPNDWTPPPQPYGPPYQGGSYVPGQYTPPPPPSPPPRNGYGSYNPPSALSGLGSIASGVGQIIGGTLGLGGGVLGGVGSEFLHGIYGGATGLRVRVRKRGLETFWQLAKSTSGPAADKVE
jgi:hypothetical protein